MKCQRLELSILGLIGLCLFSTGCVSIFRSNATREEEINSAIKGLDSLSWGGPAQAMETLVKYNAKEAIPKLITLLDRKRYAFRAEAVWALSRLDAREAVPKIIALLADENEDVRLESVAALWRMEVRAAMPAIAKLLNDKVSGVRRKAVSALWGMDAREFIPAIAKLVQDEDGAVRLEAIDALNGMKAREAIPELVKALSYPDRYTRKETILSLGHLNAKETDTDILPLSNDKYKIVRDSACDTLHKFGVSDSEIKAAPVPINKDPKYRIAIDVPMLVLGHTGEPYFEYISSDTWVEKISVAYGKIKLDDMSGMHYQVLPGAKWFWGHNAPASWFLYAEAGSIFGHLHTGHTGKSETLNVFTYGLGAGYAWADGVLNIMCGFLGNSTDKKWVGDQGNELLPDTIKPTIMFTVGPVF